MLNAIQRFFAYHMIETYGCDYSTSGLSFDTLHSKLKAFLELRTVDGPRHDTYVLYYSGHTHGSGEWALAGKFIFVRFTVVLCNHIETRKFSDHCFTDVLYDYYMITFDFFEITYFILVNCNKDLRILQYLERKIYVRSVSL